MRIFLPLLLEFKYDTNYNGGSYLIINRLKIIILGEYIWEDISEQMVSVAKPIIT